ncbi:hypothetical protein [Priestia megaterium]|uniref:hypothetical protein n=1 Tax=Priestia megaterium TaxID=1404 RepID=UPI002877BBCB|nr:hypothetical protein [Priestia megaterium]
METVIDISLVILLAVAAVSAICFVRLKENGFAIISLLIAVVSVISVAINR